MQIRDISVVWIKRITYLPLYSYVFVHFFPVYSLIFLLSELLFVCFQWFLFELLRIYVLWICPVVPSMLFLLVTFSIYLILYFHFAASDAFTHVHNERVRGYPLRKELLSDLGSFFFFCFVFWSFMFSLFVIVCYFMISALSKMTYVCLIRENA